MKKIPTLFERDFTKRGQITRYYHHEVDWVLAGEGIATRKYDGTAILIQDGKVFKRYTLHPDKPAPEGFVKVDTDDETGKSVGWVPAGDHTDDKWLNEALEDTPADTLPDGTYELLGPKIQKNPEKYEKHTLLRHAGAQQFKNVPVDYDELRGWLSRHDIEGLVWHHPGGRMAKIKLRDFGLRRNG